MKFKKQIAALSMSVLMIMLIACGGGSGSSGDNSVADTHLDETFGNNGFVIAKLDYKDDTIYSIAVLNDDSIIVAGTCLVTHDNATAPGIIIAKYSPDGVLDTSFGANGYTIYSVSGIIEGVNDLVILSDGRIVLCGYRYDNVNIQQIVCFKEDGSLDTDFGSDGVVPGTTGEYIPGILYDIEPLPDGKFLACGYADTGAYTSLRKAFIARYNSDGTRDNKFGVDGDGTVMFVMSGSDSLAYEMAIHENKIYMVGRGKDDSGQSISSISRLNYDGEYDGWLDTTFGTDGVLLVDVVPSQADIFTSLVINSDNKIYITGERYGSYDAFNIMCYNTDGSADTTFGTNGELVTNLATYTDRAGDIIILNDGSLFAGGYATSLTSREFAFIKLSSAGVLDNGFNGNGKLVHSISEKNESCMMMAMQSTGNVIAAGYANNGSDNDFVLMRFKFD